MELKEKVVLITGGASGMGAATARRLAGCGMHVALLDRNLSAAETEARALNSFACYCDVSQAESVEVAVQTVVARYGSIHLAVNCAGIAPAKRIVDKSGAPMPLEDFAQVIGVNLVGSFNVLRCVAAQMSRQETLTSEGERGVIINTASVAAFEGQTGQAAYSASKGGVVAMTLPAARELASYGIRVMTIAPGIMATPMMAGMPEKVQASLAESVTFPKRLGLPEEYAALVEHIGRNEYLNGEVIRLDGAIRMNAR